MDLNALPSTLLNLAGGALLGIGVGHLGYMTIPSLSLDDDVVQSAKINIKGGMLLMKAATNVFSRLLVEVATVAAASNMLMSQLEGRDPTNGGVALISLVMSDPKMMHDFRVLNSLIHVMLTNGIALADFEQLLKDKEDKLVDIAKSVITKKVESFFG